MDQHREVRREGRFELEVRRIFDRAFELALTKADPPLLAGLLVGLLGQHIEPYNAAKLAVYLHGSAGDEAAWSSSQGGMKAGDIIQAIPMAFRRVVTR